MIGNVEALGYKVATVTYDPAKDLSRFQRRRSLQLTLLADTGSKVIRAFGLFDERYPAGTYIYGVAHPMIVVLDKSGSVTHRFSDINNQRRPTAQFVLRALGTANPR